MTQIIRKAANISEIREGEASGTAVSFIVGTVKMSVMLDGLVDSAEEKARLEAELEHQRKFLASVRAKLSNAKFVEHAPEAVISNERKKEADAVSRIATLEASLAAMENK